MSVLKILGVSGSIRKASVNSGLLRAASKFFPSGIEFQIADISDLPLFNSDLESPKFPDSVLRFKQQVSEAHGILFAVPENNYTISAPLKNALDWASRGTNSWEDKPAAIVGAGGGAGSSRAHYHLRQSGVFLNIHFLNKPELAVREFEPPTKFNFENGELVDEDTRTRLQGVVDALIAWVKRIGKQ